jgi:hypothetical protein
VDRYDRDEVRSKGVSVLGVISLVIGIIGTLISLIPCVGLIGMPVTGLGLLLGLIGLVVSLVGKQSGLGFPIAGSAVSLAGLAVGGLWLGLMAAAVGTAQQQEQARQVQAAEEAQAIKDGPAVKVSAADLAKAYTANEIAADSKYKDKILEITGAVEQVRREGLGETTVELATGEEDDNVLCKFDKGHQQEMEKLQPPQPVTIRGKCKGRDGNGIHLQKCVLVR